MEYALFGLKCDECGYESNPLDMERLEARRSLVAVGWVIDVLPHPRPTPEVVRHRCPVCAQAQGRVAAHDVPPALTPWLCPTSRPLHPTEPQP